MCLYYWWSFPGWVSGSRHRSRGSTGIVRDSGGFLLIPLQCLSQLFLWRPTCANLKTRLYEHARATPRPSRVASESNGLIERERGCIFTLLLGYGLQFSAPLRSPFPLSGWILAVHAGTCSPRSSLLRANAVRAWMSEHYNSHTRSAPSAPLSLPPDQRQRDTVRTPPDFQNRKSSRLVNCERQERKTGLKPLSWCANIFQMSVKRVGARLYNLTSLFGSLIAFWNYSGLYRRRSRFWGCGMS